VVNLIAHGINLEEVREIAEPLGVGRHGAVDLVGLFRLYVLEAVVAEKEEELVLAVEEFRRAHRPSGRAGPVVRATGRLRALRSQLFGERRVSGGLGLLNASPVSGVGRALRGVETLLPVLPGELAVVIVRAALGRERDGGAGRVTFAGVKGRGLDFELGDSVRVGQVARASAPGHAGHAVEREFIPADAAGRA